MGALGMIASITVIDSLARLFDGSSPFGPTLMALSPVHSSCLKPSSEAQLTHLKYRS
jgi:hypothetical protein